MEELDYEIGSDDMERTNVVKKGQRDYVPPIPDFIDDLGLFKDQSVTNVTNLLNNDKISVHYEDDDSNLDWFVFSRQIFKNKIILNRSYNIVKRNSREIGL